MCLDLGSSHQGTVGVRGVSVAVAVGGCGVEVGEEMVAGCKVAGGVESMTGRLQAVRKIPRNMHTSQLLQRGASNIRIENRVMAITPSFLF